MNSTEHKPNETATKVPPLGRPVIITGGGDGGDHIDCSLVRKNLLPVKYLGAQILMPIRYFIFEGRRDLYYKITYKCILFINFEKKHNYQFLGFFLKHLPLLFSLKRDTTLNVLS